MFLNEAYPTRDSVIPWRLFMILSANIETIWARANYEQARSVMAALINVMGSKDNAGSSMLKDLIRQAFPEMQDGS